MLPGIVVIASMRVSHFGLIGRFHAAVGWGDVMPAQPFQTAPERAASLRPLAAPSLSAAPQISGAWPENEAVRNQTLIKRCFIRQRAPDLPGPPSELPSARSPSFMLMWLPLLIYEPTAPSELKRSGQDRIRSVLKEEPD